MNKKGQGAVWILLTFAIITITIIIIAPFYLKFMNQLKSTVSPQLRNLTQQGLVGGDQAANDFDNIMGRSINIWDEAMIFLLFLNILILFISAFLMDTSPFWAVMYIIAAVVVVGVMPQFATALDNLYYSTLATEGNQLVYISFVREHFGLFLSVVAVMTMIILFAKPYIVGRGTNYG